MNTHFFQNADYMIRYIETHYNADQQRIIGDFMTYYMNEYRQRNHLNCASQYIQNQDKDVSGELEEIAFCGFHFEKQFRERQQQ